MCLFLHLLLGGSGVLLAVGLEGVECSRDSGLGFLAVELNVLAAESALAAFSLCWSLSRPSIQACTPAMHGACELPLRSFLTTWFQVSVALCQPCSLDVLAVEEALERRSRQEGYICNALAGTSITTLV